MQLISKENLLETDRSAGGVIVNVALEKATVAKASVTEAVAGLLGEHFGDFLRDAIDPRNDGFGKT